MYHTPTPAELKDIRGKMMGLETAPLFDVPEFALQGVQVSDTHIYFPIYNLMMQQVAWNSRKFSEKMYSQTEYDCPGPVFTSHPEILQAIHKYRAIVLCEGPFDYLALVGVCPFAIATNSIRQQPEIKEWIRDWNLHIYLAFDFDKPDPRTGKMAGQDMVERMRKEFAEMNVSRLHWINVIKDPGDAYARLGSAFHDQIRSQIRELSQGEVNG